MDLSHRGTKRRMVTPEEQARVERMHNALLEHFEKQAMTDMAIEVRVLNAEGQATKRAKADDGAAPTGFTRAIQAHAIILSSSSAYFSRAIQGGWKESSDRKIHIELENDEDFEALHRLVKLSYCTSYTGDGERRLEADELMQLIRVGNAFEFTDAVKECAAALQEGMDLERAVRCIELALALSEVEEIKGLGMAAQEFLATEAGMVHELFKPAESDAGEGRYVLGRLRLSNRIAALPIDALEAMLTSPKLCCKSKDDVFWLVKAWHRAQGQGEAGSVERQELVNRVSKLVQTHVGGMTPTYVLSVVATDPIIIQAGLVSAVLATALGREVLSRRIAEEMQSVSHRDTPAAVEASWTLRGCFTANEIAQAATGAPVFKVLGLVAGYPWGIQLRRHVLREGSSTARVRIATGHLCKTNGATAAGHGGFFKYGRVVACDRPAAVSWREGDAARWFSPTRGLWGASGLFAGMTWDEVLGAGSPYLAEQGQLDVEVTITR